jgi:hypothetical protein
MPLPPIILHDGSSGLCLKKAEKKSWFSEKNIQQEKPPSKKVDQSIIPEMTTK